GCSVDTSSPNLWVAWQGSFGSSYALAATGLDGGHNFYNLAILPNTWVTDEFDYQNATSKTATNGIFAYTRNGIDAAYQFSGVSKPTFGQTWPWVNYGCLYLDQVSDNHVAAGTYIYYDSFYLDDSRQRVVISNEST